MSGGAPWRWRTIAQLRAGLAVKVDDAAEEEASIRRTAARIAWLRRTLDLWSDAMTAADSAWMKLVEPYADRDEDEEIPDLPPPPEQAEVDRLWQLLEDVRRRDRWPLHLHWTV
jgi:hypothetical protein